MNNIHTYIYIYIYIYAGCPRSFSRGGVATKNITCVKDLYTLVQVGARLHDTPRIHAHEQTKTVNTYETASPGCYLVMLFVGFCWWLFILPISLCLGDDMYRIYVFRTETLRYHGDEQCLIKSKL